MKFSEAARARRRGLPDRASWVVFARELDRPDYHLHAGSLWLARIFPGPISRSFFAPRFDRRVHDSRRFSAIGGILRGRLLESATIVSQGCGLRGHFLSRLFCV